MEPTQEFAHVFYEQLCKVFGYQGLVPSYDETRIVELFDAWKDSKNILCLKVIDTTTNEWIASSISLGFGKHCYTWASTSLREGKDYCQSEAMRWVAIQHWREYGCVDMDMVGIRAYKKKFNPEEIQVPRIILTRFRLLIFARNMAQKIYWFFNSIKGKLTKKKSEK